MAKKRPTIEKLGPVQQQCLAGPPLTHEERLALIRKPFPSIARVYGGRSWGGINNSKPEYAALRRLRHAQDLSDDRLAWFAQGD